MQHTAPHCTTLQHTAARCNTPQHTDTHCNTLTHTATYCNTLQYTLAKHSRMPYLAVCCSVCQCVAGLFLQIIFRCNTLRHSAPRCSTLQHTATHWHTLQHTATRCNTHWHRTVGCLILQASSCKLSMKDRVFPQKNQPKYGILRVFGTVFSLSKEACSYFYFGQRAHERGITEECVM